MEPATIILGLTQAIKLATTLSEGLQKDEITPEEAAASWARASASWTSAATMWRETVAPKSEAPEPPPE